MAETRAAVRRPSSPVVSSTSSHSPPTSPLPSPASRLLPPPSSPSALPSRPRLPYHYDPLTSERQSLSCVPLVMSFLDESDCPGWRERHILNIMRVCSNPHLRHQHSAYPTTATCSLLRGNALCSSCDVFSERIRLSWMEREVHSL